jgi:predicted transcriptional regulator
MSGERAVLLSLRPRFAQAILSEEKTIELRRTRVNTQPGSLVILYSSSPARAVVGTATLSRVEVGTPYQLWEHVRVLCGLSRDEYDSYFHGAKLACGLHLHNIKAFSAPIPLAELRLRVGVEPPQSFRYLTAFQAKRLMQASDIANPRGLPRELAADYLVALGG